MRATLVLAALALALAADASAAVTLKGLDASDYPRVAVTVVAPSPSAQPPVLRENGRRMRGVEARNLARDKSIVLALDRSQSMRGAALPNATRAARRFVAAKRGSDRLAIVAFGAEAVELSRFSTATIDADTALRAISVDRKRGTALYDAIVLAANRLAAEASRARVLVVVTDGDDVSSEATRDDAIASARRAGVAVYAIGIEGAGFAPAPLRKIAGATGGRYFAAADSSALTAVYRALASELARTWRLEYITAARPGDRIRLSAAVGSSRAASLAVVLPGAADAGPASSLIPAAAYETGFGSVLVALLVGGLVFLAIALVSRARRGSWLQSRVEPHIKTLRSKPDAKEDRERLALAAELFSATERSFGHLRAWRKLEGLIERADLSVKAVTLVYISVGAAFALGLFAAVAALPTLVILAAMALGGASPVTFVAMKAKRRTKAFDEQLPDILLTIAASLKAGHSFKQSIQTVVDDGQPPASKEFQRVVTEIQLGRPMDQALTDMTARLGSPNFDFVMTAVAIQRQVGGSLAGLFDMAAETVRQRQQFSRKIRSLTAMGRGSAYVLVALPFVLAGLITMLNPTYMSPLYSSSTGHMLIGTALVSMVFGSLILKRIASFKG